MSREDKQKDIITELMNAPNWKDVCVIIFQILFYIFVYTESLLPFQSYTAVANLKWMFITYLFDINLVSLGQALIDWHPIKTIWNRVVAVDSRRAVLYSRLQPESIWYPVFRWPALNSTITWSVPFPWAEQKNKQTNKQSYCNVGIHLGSFISWVGTR